MDLVTLSFLTIIVVVGGFTSLFADWLGRKLGKKRLRLGILRPKHTAALGVFTSGVTISVFTILLGYLMSSDVRQWIREGHRAIGELHDERNKTINERKTNLRLQSANDVFRGENLKLLHDIVSARQTREDLQHQIAKFDQEVRGYRSSLTLLQTHLALDSKTLQSTQGKLIATNSRLLLASKQLASAQKGYTQLKLSYSQLQNDIRSQYAEDYRLRFDNDKQGKANRALIKTNDALSKSATDLTEKISLAQTELKDKTAKLDGLQLQLTQTQEQVEAAGRQLQFLSDQSKRLNESVVSSRTHPIIFAQHEELARISVPAGLTRAEVRDQLTSLIRSAQIAAEARGAHSPSLSIPSAGIFEHEDPVTHRNISPEEILDALTRRLSDNPYPQVVIASSSLNAFQNEPVSLDILAYPNPLVYRAGQVVAEARIDGSQSEEVIYEKITEFLRSRVRQRAQSDHLIPHSNDEYGLVDSGQLLRIVKDVSLTNRLVRVQALATDNTRAGDPLRLQFRIR